MMYQDFTNSYVAKLDREGALIQFSDGHRQWIDKMDFSYASWYLAARSPIGTLLLLKIRAYVVKTKHPGVAA